MLQLLLAAVAATAPAPGESPVREPECRITDFGVQGDSRLIGVRPELGTASGRVMLNEDAPMAAHTDTIPAKLGLSFGIKHDFLGIPEGEPIELTLTYPRMKMLSGATRSMSTSLFDPAVTAGTSFTFEIKEELVPGTWTFKFHHRGRLLLCRSEFGNGAMSPILVGTIVFLCTLGGALLGNWLRTLLPVEHLGEDTKDTVKVAIGLVATMTALILGLVTASAKKSFDDVDTALEHSAMDMLALDRLLARYGPETAPIRNDMHQALALRIEVMWPTGAARHDVDPLRSSMLTGVENLAGALRGLNPADENQQSLRNRALDLGETLLQTRWRIFASGGTSIPLPFLIVLVFWLTMIFTSFGLFAPRNGTVFAALFVCALSVGSAVFLILELDGPFDGLIRASPEPLQYALAHLNQ